MKKFTKTAARQYNTTLNTNLMFIDDIMMFPMEMKQAVSLFNLIEHLHQDASMIITTNKSPDELVNILADEVLAMAILNLLLFKCEVVKTFRKIFQDR
jgi:DNA replication protein DnaC